MINENFFLSPGGVFFRKTQSFMKAAFNQIGLNLIDGLVLLNVGKNDGTIQENIAHDLALDTTAVTRSLKELEKKKLIKRIIDSNNQRTKCVYMEPEGIEYNKKLKAVMKYWHNIILYDFTEDEQKMAIKIFEHLKICSIDMDINQVVKNLFN